MHSCKAGCGCRLGEVCEIYRARRDLIAQIMTPKGLLVCVPQSAFYAMTDLSKVGSDTNELVRRLLEEERVATATGEVEWLELNLNNGRIICRKINPKRQWRGFVSTARNTITVDRRPSKNTNYAGGIYLIQ